MAKRSAEQAIRDDLEAAKKDVETLKGRLEARIAAAKDAADAVTAARGALEAAKGRRDALAEALGRLIPLPIDSPPAETPAEVPQGVVGGEPEALEQPVEAPAKGRNQAVPL